MAKPITCEMCAAKGITKVFKRPAGWGSHMLKKHGVSQSKRDLMSRARNAEESLSGSMPIHAGEKVPARSGSTDSSILLGRRTRVTSNGEEVHSGREADALSFCYRCRCDLASLRKNLRAAGESDHVRYCPGCGADQKPVGKKVAEVVYRQRRKRRKVTPRVEKRGADSTPAAAATE